MSRRQLFDATDRAICDYSLMHAKSRPAAVGDKLTVCDMGSRTYGLTDDVATAGQWGNATAVCLLPGTEVAFDEPVKRYNPEGTWRNQSEVIELKSSVGIFCQVDKENLCTHHDAFEFAEDHDRVLINHLVQGQRLTVLQLPAAPKTEDEAQEQKRVAVVA
jgi:hypothetical protein